MLVLNNCGKRFAWNFNAFCSLKATHTLERVLKPVLYWQISSREATFFFCLSSISSKWLQLKTQAQREKLWTTQFEELT